MKRRLLFGILLGLLCFLCVPLYGKHYKAPKLKLTSLQYELGTINQDDSVYVLDVPFKNVGDGDLVFEDISPDCPCIHVSFEKKVYPPKSKGNIHIEIDLSIPPQEMDKGIYIYSNATPFDTSIEVRFHGILERSRKKK